MLDYLKLCLSSQFKKARKALLENYLNLSSYKFKCCTKRRETNYKMPTSDLSWLSSSISAQLNHVFNLIDTNGDGKLSPVELKQVLISLGHGKAEAAKEAEVMVRQMDCDGDGFVDLDEFMNVMESIDQNQDGIFSESDLMEAFRVFDTDDNGLISAKELKKVLGRLGCGKCSLKECRKMIKGVDRDGDGFVDFEEFRYMMSVGC